MEPFAITLANGATLTGLANLPPASPTSPKFRPLMLGIHGASYSSAYFDVDEKHTATLTSNALGIPWVAIDRPGYKGSTSFYPIPEGSSYHGVLGEWLHRYILPALWRTFGEPHGCNSMVLLCHSLGTPSAVIAAAEHSKQQGGAKRDTYPFSGIIISGYGTQSAGQHHSKDDAPRPEIMSFPPEVKDDLMLPHGTCEPSMYAHTARLNVPFPSREIGDAFTAFQPRFRTEWAPHVRVPIQIGIAERDPWWKGDEEHVRDFVAAFTASPKVEGSVVRGAPHNLEMSYWAQAWYVQCFGFGLECAAWLGVAR